MPSLIDMRRRIPSVRNTQQITKAMKMISAARLRRAQDRVFNARPYAGLLREVLESLAGRIEAPAPPLLAGRREFIGIFSRLDFSQAQEIASDVIAAYAEEKTDGVYLIYNEFKSVLSQRVVLEQLLPLREFQPPPSRAAAFLKVDYIYEQPPQEIYAALLPNYVESLIFLSLLESVAAEHAARMTAMDSATSNAGEMIDHLTLTMNRIRQAAITKEIIEVVSGAAAS